MICQSLFDVAKIGIKHVFCKKNNNYLLIIGNFFILYNYFSAFGVINGESLGMMV